MRILFLTLIFLSSSLYANEKVYEQCILDNIEKANTKEAVELVKEICQDKAKRASCEGISAKEMSDEELLSGKCKPRKKNK